MSVNDLETLQELNEHYIRSVRTSDVRCFEEHLAEDFMNSNPDCSLVDRAWAAGFEERALIRPPWP